MPSGMNHIEALRAAKRAQEHLLNGPVVPTVAEVTPEVRAVPAPEMGTVTDPASHASFFIQVDTPHAPTTDYATAHPAPVTQPEQQTWSPQPRTDRHDTRVPQPEPQVEPISEQEYPYADPTEHIHAIEQFFGQTETYDDQHHTGVLKPFRKPAAPTVPEYTRPTERELRRNTLNRTLTAFGASAVALSIITAGAYAGIYAGTREGDTWTNVKEWYGDRDLIATSHELPAIEQRYMSVKSNITSLGNILGIIK